MFELEAEQFRRAGVQLGHDLRSTEESLFGEVLASFGLSMRNEALQMARLYAYLNCFENSVREFVRDRLEEKYGTNWWDSAVPEKIRRHADSREADAAKNSWLEGQNKGKIYWIDFGQLSDIIIAKWDDFEDVIPTQAWIKQKFEDLEKARNFVAHNRLLLPAEFSRIEMHLADWNKQIGF
ncbi:MAG: hypothetical protein KF857_03455 [Fimbriimonadaceae bacterium]|nr:hypothetical protein [Fimbriimonadaceae bacterium]